MRGEGGQTAALPPGPSGLSRAPHAPAPISPPAHQGRDGPLQGHGKVSSHPRAHGRAGASQVRSDVLGLPAPITRKLPEPPCHPKAPCPHSPRLATPTPTQQPERPQPARIPFLSPCLAASCAWKKPELLARLHSLTLHCPMGPLGDLCSHLIMHPNSALTLQPGHPKLFDSRVESLKEHPSGAGRVP